MIPRRQEKGESLQTCFPWTIRFSCCITWSRELRSARLRGSLAFTKRQSSKLLVRFATACRDFLAGQMRRLELRHLEIDEQVTFVACEQRRLHDDDRDNPRAGD